MTKINEKAMAAIIEAAILKSLAEKVFALVQASTDENLKLQVSQLIGQVMATKMPTDIVTPASNCE